MQSESLLLSAVDSPALQWICSSVQTGGLNSSVLQEQELPIMNRELQVIDAFEIQLTTKHMLEDMTSLNDVKGHHREEAAS